MTDHPEESAWMMFLYRECGVDESATLRSHLQRCSLCRQKVDAWQATMIRLDSWAIEAAGIPKNMDAAVTVRGIDRRHSVLVVAASLAAVLLAFLVGRTLTTAGSVDVAALKAELGAELQEQVARRVRAELEPTIRAQFAALKPDRQTLIPLIETESTRIAAATLADWARQDSADRQRLQHLLAGVLDNQVALRTDLENLAIEAEAQIVRTRRELVRLAMTAQPMVESKETRFVIPPGNEPPQL